MRDGILYFLQGPAAFFFGLSPFLYWSHGGNFDVVIDEIHGLPMFAPLWAGKSKVIALIHEVAQEIWTEMYPFPISLIGQGLERLWLWIYKLKEVPFWVDCQGVKDDLVKYGITADSVTVVSCAIDRPPTIRLPKEKRLTLIFLARLVKMKGVETALQVFAKVLKKQPKAQFWVVGSGEGRYVEYLRAEARRLGIAAATTFWGRVSQREKFSLLRRAHFLIHTSVREGFGLTVLEAGSQGTPTIAFKVSALKEIVQDKQTGYLVPHGSSRRMAEVVVKNYKGSTYSALSAQARRFEKTFNWRKFTKQSLDFLQ